MDDPSNEQELPTGFILRHLARIMRADMAKGISFDESAARIVEDFGEETRPHLEDGWKLARRPPERSTAG